MPIPKGAERPWDLDPLPLPISSDEWRGIEAGVAQRATLLDAVLQDLYGPQRLLAEGLAPTELAFGHSELPLALRRRPRRAAAVALHVYAADLARSPDGRWWVLERSRAGALRSGLCAREPHDAVPQVLPDAFRDLHDRAASLRVFATLRRLARPPRTGRRDRRDAADRDADARGRTTRPTSSTRSSRAISASAGRGQRPHRPRRSLSG
jgi:uncharacterized circularly permuted ATP-grasp superfamily protein